MNSNATLKIPERSEAIRILNYSENRLRKKSPKQNSKPEDDSGLDNFST
jgi:hypothetical protein